MSTDIAMVTRQYQVGNRQWLLSEPNWKANVTLNSSLFSLNGTSQVQTVTITGTPTGGTFMLSFGGVSTGDPSVDPQLPYNATAAQVQAAIASFPFYGANEDLLYVGTGNVTVTGPVSGVYTVTFGGQLAATNVPQLQVASSALTGGTSPAVATAITTAAAPGLYPNGFIPSGTAIGLVTSTGLYGPYDPTASDGRQTCAGLLYDDAVAVRWDGSVASLIGNAAVVNNAVVSLGKLPVQASGPGYVDSNAKTALAAVRFQA